MLTTGITAFEALSLGHSRHHCLLMKFHVAFRFCSHLCNLLHLYLNFLCYKMVSASKPFFFLGLFPVVVFIAIVSSALLVSSVSCSFTLLPGGFFLPIFPFGIFGVLFGPSIWSFLRATLPRDFLSYKNIEFMKIKNGIIFYLLIDRIFQ